MVTMVTHQYSFGSCVLFVALFFFFFFFCPVPEPTVGQPDGPKAVPAGRLSSTADKENIQKDSHSCPHRPPLPAMPRSSRKGTDAVNSAPLDVSSNDDEANEKLENCTYCTYPVTSIDIVHLFFQYFWT